MLLMIVVYGPELVRLETDGQEIIHIVPPKLLRKMLEEEEDEEGTL
jgi:hypothetical protein